jgi:ATP-dependent Clp protease ATP-binding subunit ClpB
MSNNTKINTAQDYLIRGKDYLAAQENFELVGREEELKKLTAILMRKNANSILLVGSGGVGCSAITMGLEQSKQDPNATFDIISKRFFWLDTDGLFASGDPNEINESFNKTLRTLERTSDSVLVLDDMKDFIEAARNNGCTNLINGLMRSIKKGNTQVVFETRDQDLDVVLKAHSDMRELYTMLDVQEPHPELLHDIVKTTAKQRLEAHHKIKISDEALDAAIEMTNKYRVRDLGLSRAQPERSLTLLDRALTTYRLDAHSRAPGLDDLEARLASVNAQLGDENYSEDQGGKSRAELETLQAALLSDIQETKEGWDAHQLKIKSIYRDLRSGEESVRELEERIEAQLEAEEEQRIEAQRRAEEAGATGDVHAESKRTISSFMVGSANLESDEVSALRDKVRHFEKLVKEQKSEFEKMTAEINDSLMLDRAQVLGEFSSISGIPVAKLTQDERAKLLKLDENLGNRVFGQDEAVDKLANQVRVSRAGLQDPNKPQASFLFLGPSGVGKTELAKALTSELLDDEGALLRFDMSEYMEKHAVAKLIGAPPGYEGYEAGGILTNEMRKNPRRIILFDEIEKAHPDVFNVFLQILDDARLTDNRGLTVSFRDSIIMMTTNIGTPHFLNAPSFEDAKELALEDLDKEYRPEFLNRFNGRQNIVCFETLSLPVVEMIAKRDVGKLNKMVQANSPDLSVDISDEALAAMCRDHYKPVNGARGITGYVEGKIKPEIANTILFNGDAKGTIMIDYDHEKKEAIVKAPVENPVNEPEVENKPSVSKAFNM